MTNTERLKNVSETDPEQRRLESNIGTESISNARQKAVCPVGKQE